MTTGQLTHIPSAYTYDAFDIADTSCKSKTLPYKVFVAAKPNDFLLNGVAITTTDGVGSGISSKGYIQLNFVYS